MSMFDWFMISLTIIMTASAALPHVKTIVKGMLRWNQKRIRRKQAEQELAIQKLVMQELAKQYPMKLDQAKDQ